MTKTLSLPSLLLLGGLTLLLTATGRLYAATPTAEQALRLMPVQGDVELDTPTDEEIARCTIDTEEEDGMVGWAVRGEAGQLLRRFLDTNDDNKVDRWCYYQSGIEVYRDIDADHNGKADQYRWLGTQGIRWGLDDDEDGQIDRWKAISAEEVTREVVAALSQGNTDQFQRLLLTAEELEDLGLGETWSQQVSRLSSSANTGFADLARRQTAVGRQARWIHFGSNPPGLVPAGTQGSLRDVVVYENVVAMVDEAGRDLQIQIGTLIQVGDGWRIFDLPHNLIEAEANTADNGFFFQASLARVTPTQEEGTPPEGMDEEIQEWIEQLEEVDLLLAEGPRAENFGQLNELRANILEQLAGKSESPEDKIAWLRQMADTVSAAVQGGGYPQGVQRLQNLYERLAEESPRSPLVPYVRFRTMTAAYSVRLEQPEADFAEIQQEWLEKLEEFVEQFSTSTDAAEAMLQLAIAEEFAGNEDSAKEWYQRIAAEFPNTDLASKSTGAIRRLNSVGRPIPLAGQTLGGQQVDLANLRGKVVLIHYWATWCEPCKEDIEKLKQLQARYGRQGFTLIGVSLDNQRDTLAGYLRENRLPWPQLFEEGGLDSRLANELGILTLPTMILVDKRGNVANRNIHVSQVEEGLQSLLR